MDQIELPRVLHIPRPPSNLSTPSTTSVCLAHLPSNEIRGKWIHSCSAHPSIDHPTFFLQVIPFICIILSHSSGSSSVMISSRSDCSNNEWTGRVLPSWSCTFKFQYLCLQKHSKKTSERSYFPPLMSQPLPKESLIFDGHTEWWYQIWNSFCCHSGCGWGGQNKSLNGVDVLRESPSSQQLASVGASFRCSL